MNEAGSVYMDEDGILWRSYDLNANQEHLHNFTIPVEWAVGYYDNEGDFHIDPSDPITVVTKLMCECGEEKRRA